MHLPKITISSSPGKTIFVLGSPTASSKWNLSEWTKAILFFFVKNINSNNVKHYSPIWGVLGPFFGCLKIFFISNILKNAMIINWLCFWLTSKQLETKLNYKKKLWNFMKFILKNSRKTTVKLFGIFNRYGHFLALQPSPNLNSLATFTV